MTTNLADLYKSYTKSIDSSSKSNLNTALFRYTLPELGFVIPKRSVKRFHPYDIQMAIEFLSQFYLLEDTDIQLIEAQKKILLTSNKSQSSIRHQKKVLKDFIAYFNRYKKSSNKKQQNKQKEKTFELVEDLSFIEKSRPKQKTKQVIRLSFNPNNYENTDTEKTIKELERIEKELKEIETYLKKLGLRKSTIETTCLRIYGLLGWQFKQYNSLEKVGLNKLITVFNIYPSIEDFDKYEKYCVGVIKAREKSKKLAKKTTNFVLDFFDNYEVTNKETKKAYINALINIAKFLYQDITDEEEYPNYEDISVIRRLRILSNNFPKNNKNLIVKLPTWEIIIKSFLEIKRRADSKAYAKSRKSEKVNSLNMQKFLILGFFVLVPPPRQRIVRELKIGETFKHGLFVDGVFVPYSELQNKQQAKYYIHLQPEDYKTGNKYGEWLGEFPNMKFPDNTTFYDYLHKWLYLGCREKIMNKNNSHNYLFSGAESNTPFTRGMMSSVISRIFYSTIGLKLYPHKLRAIYRTYLADIEADQQTIESSAFWMRHSPEIARESYTKQTLDNKLKPGLKAITEINNSLLKV